MRAIVTAGGTQIPIDDVRVITNKSKGMFLWQIACELVNSGVDVTVVGSEALYERVGAKIPEKVTFVPFVTYDDLARELETAIGSTPPDLLFMGAAVSDYGIPNSAPGKISSSKRYLTIKLERLPKILAGLRERCGKKTFIVGFKLTSRASEEEMLDAARKQQKECRLNLTVANDAARMGKGQHPIIMVTPEGGAIHANGAKENVAHELVEFVLRRAKTTWFESVYSRQLDGMRKTGSNKAACELLKFAQMTKLLTDSVGNISVCAAIPGLLWVTPRGVANKGQLPVSRLVIAGVDFYDQTVTYQSKRKTDKPSIDTSVHARLYKEAWKLDALIHTHNAWLITKNTTSFPYPCGTQEEAKEIYDRTASFFSGFAINLIHHGQLIGLERGGIDRLKNEWQEVAGAYKNHLNEIGQPDAVGILTLHPIFNENQIVGVAAQHPKGWYSLFLLEKHCKDGLGASLLEIVNNKHALLGVHKNCKVANYYLERGFRIRDYRENDLLILEPPSLRNDVHEAATACIYNPLTQKVLLIKRNTKNWKGLWANPGGRVENGEKLLQAASREALEEVGIHIDGLKPQAEQSLLTAYDNGKVAYHVTCYLVHVPDHLSPIINLDEVEDARWFDIDEALKLPLGWGTKHALRAFFSR